MEADDLKQTLPKSLVLMNLRLMFYFNVKKINWYLLQSIHIQFKAVYIGVLKFS